MGGGFGAGGSSSNNSSETNTNSNKTLGNTSTINPYIASQTTNYGTNTNFVPNTAMSSIYNFTNKNIDQLLNEYLNPSVNTPQNQALINSYTKILNDESRKALENNIIAPLTQRNMLRSSQATDLYNNLANKQNEYIADYTNSVIANSRNNTADIINTLMNLAFQGYNAVNGNQALSLNTSLGNASSNSTSSTTGSTKSLRYGGGVSVG